MWVYGHLTNDKDEDANTYGVKPPGYNSDEYMTQSSISQDEIQTISGVNNEARRRDKSVGRSHNW